MPRKSAIKCFFGCNGGTFHKFPHPDAYPTRFQEWKTILSKDIKEKPDTFIYNNIRLCNAHFEECYIYNGKRLASNAIPTLNKISTPRSIVTSDEIDQKVDIKNELFPYLQLQEPEDDIEANRSNVLNKLKIKILKLRNKCRTLSEEVYQARKLSLNKAFLKVVEDIPESVTMFTNMNLQKVLNNPRRRKYTVKDQILCLNIYKESPNAYSFLQRFFSLPSKRTILKILSSVSLTTGIDKTIMQQLKNIVRKMPDEKRLCSLIFDEMPLTPGLYLQKNLGHIVGFEDFGMYKTTRIADHALVFMLKGLKARYVQPICFTFCQRTTNSEILKRLIINVIEQIQSTGLKVICTVCDHSSINISTINSLMNDTKEKYLQEGTEYSSLSFEVNRYKIFPLYDPPHLLKGFRNHLLTKNLRYVYNGQTYIAKWNHLQMLHDVDSEEPLEYRLLQKLTDCHVDTDKIPKTKVKYASQVFSRDVSATMRFLAKHNTLPEECLGTAELLLIMNRLFDSFNGHSYNITEMNKSALRRYSSHFKLWKEILPILHSMVFKIKKDGKNKYVKVPSIKNWIHNIQVLKEMYSHLNIHYNVRSLLTRNLNQDPLDNFFSRIKSNGIGNTAPTCFQFINAYKTLIENNLSSITPHPVDANCEKDMNKYLISLKC